MPPFCVSHNEVLLNIFRCHQLLLPYIWGIWVIRLFTDAGISRTPSKRQQLFSSLESIKYILSYYLILTQSPKFFPRDFSPLQCSFKGTCFLNICNHMPVSLVFLIKIRPWCCFLSKSFLNECRCLTQIKLILEVAILS